MSQVFDGVFVCWGNWVAARITSQSHFILEEEEREAVDQATLEAMGSLKRQSRWRPGSAWDKRSCLSFRALRKAGRKRKPFLMMTARGRN